MASEDRPEKNVQLPPEQIILPGGSKKLTAKDLERLEGGQLNRSHNRFIVDPDRKIAWVPSWVREIRFTDEVED